MNDRYERQIRFKPIGQAGQEKLKNKHILLVGCGALGSTNAENFVRAGIGKLTIIDRDYVELSNLQRQTLFTEKDCAMQVPKAIAAKNQLLEVNSTIHIDAYVMEATRTTLPPLLRGVDLIIDATDNFDTRFLINDLAHKYNIPWIMGSCVGSTGMSYTIIPGQSPCLQCLLDATPTISQTCDINGIISPAVQMVCAHQTAEALKLLVEDRKALRTKLVTFDLWNNHYQMINVSRAKKNHCPTCGNHPLYPQLSFEEQTKTEVLCGRNTVQIRSNRAYDIDQLKEQLERIGRVKKNDYLLSVEYEQYRLVFFRDGRTLIHGTNSKETAKQLFYKLIG
ncbi:MoeB/ThiF family adenylyltransferase [Fervidibacillus albus]|uniref:MoeB/ThiF family adenylyltransferase n=1 Tax=Fervidibacillus albus TaxID=2980026 RepID=A0A9E8LX93_9BACI|nr:MoeB/ThiF family adenylyltransferase [Fervidibacillus albus]WAA11352.1 MoeB/ThiF family adenylyltransferase [Fervidibacillus albus]